MSCRKALAELDRRGILDLPVQDRIYDFEHCREITIEPDIVEVEYTLSELGEVSVCNRGKNLLSASIQVRGSKKGGHHGLANDIHENAEQGQTHDHS